MATYDGVDIFGPCVKMRHLANPTAEQLNSFFGLSGTQSLYGGQRGRAFTVEGVLVGSSLGDINNAEALYHSYMDGVARVLVDTRGRTWGQVLVKAPFQPGRLMQDARGWYLDYKGLLVGLL